MDASVDSSVPIEAGLQDGGGRDSGGSPTEDAGPTITEDAGPTTDGGAGFDAGPGTTDPGAPDPAGLATDVVVDGIAIFQAVQIFLRANSIDQFPDLPILGGRDALLRVYPESTTGYDGRALNVVVEVESPGMPTRRSGLAGVTISAASYDAAPGSYFDLLLPGAWLTEASSIRVRIEDPSAGVGSGPAQWPELEPRALGAVSDLGGITLVLVPLRFDTDGSGRLPDTSPEVLETIYEMFTSAYPYANIELRVHDVVAWDEPLQYSRNVDWGDVNQFLGDLRDAEGAPAWEYWYGLMAPAETRADYCNNIRRFFSCTTGQSYTAIVRGTRNGSGVWYPELRSMFTLAHEIGHQHGLGHAPCGGASNAEASFPYSEGATGVFGWNRYSGEFYDPSDHRDFMGYCNPQWISDHNFRRLHQRNLDLHDAYAIPERTEALPQPLTFVRVESDGTITKRRVRTRRRLPGEVISITWLDAGGHPLGIDEAGKLLPTHESAVVYALPVAPVGTTTVQLDGRQLPWAP